MLVLTRRLGEQVVIDGTTTITLLRIDGNKVRLGIKAPPEVQIDRKEIHDLQFQVTKPDITPVTAVPTPCAHCGQPCGEGHEVIEGVHYCERSECVCARLQKVFG